MYAITPKADEEQVLETEHRVLMQDLTINKVPYYQVSNDCGETVYIASEVYYG